MVIRACFFTLASLIFTTASAASPESFFGGSNNQAYLDWLNAIGEDFYQSSIFLASTADASDGAAVHWSISEDGLHLELGLAVRATGWLGFGISNNGGMTGSDVLLFEADKPDEIVDAHVLEERIKPTQDDCQDWELLSASTDTDFLMIQARRKLDTGDSQDFPIIDDSNFQVPVSRIIVAWGDGPLSYHGDKYSRGAVRWFSSAGDEEDIFQESMAASSDGSFFVGASNYPVKVQDTEYVDLCISGEELRAQGIPLDEGATLIGFEPVVTTPEHVHHFLVHAGTQESPASCTDPNFPDMVYGWAPGDPSWALPNNVGASMGGEKEYGYRSFLIQIHYDNPNLKQNVTDSSGVRFYYTKTPREHEMGIFQVGDPFVTLRGNTVGDGLSHHAFDCPSECTQLFLDEPITVMFESLHMHKSGTSAFNHQIRNGEIIRTSRAEYFDFYSQGGQYAVQESFEVKPGDSFQMNCFFRNEDGERTFGLGSSEEMCITFLTYYPRKHVEGVASFNYCGLGFEEFGLPQCAASYNNGEILTDELPLDEGRTFGASPAQCHGGPLVEDNDGSSGGFAMHAGAWTMALLLSGIFY